MSGPLLPGPPTYICADARSYRSGRSGPDPSRSARTRPGVIQAEGIGGGVRVQRAPGQGRQGRRFDGVPRLERPFDRASQPRPGREMRRAAIGPVKAFRAGNVWPASATCTRPSVEPFIRCSDSDPPVRLRLSSTNRSSASTLLSTVAVVRPARVGTGAPARIPATSTSFAIASPASKDLRRSAGTALATSRRPSASTSQVCDFMPRPCGAPVIAVIAQPSGVAQQRSSGRFRPSTGTRP